MPAQSISLNNAYNDRLRKMLYDMEHVDIIKRQPEMLGGGSHENQKYLLPGNSGQYPPLHMLAEYKMQGGALLMPRTVGGRQNKVKKQGVAKALRTIGRAVKPLGKNLKPVKEALASRAVRELEGMPVVEAEVVGGKVSRMKKAKKWTDYAEDTAYKALGLAQAAKSVGGAKPKKKRAPSARAAIVKKVMAEKGLSMIEASKYVKANGLY